MVVIDTSIAYKWFNSEEEDSDIAFKVLEHHLKKQNVIFVPDIILYELSNVWSTKTSLTQAEAVVNLRQLKEHALNIIHVDFTLLEKAISISRKYHLSVYDGYYVVLAQQKGCDFITADTRLVQQTKLSFIKLLRDYPAI